MFAAEIEFLEKMSVINDIISWDEAHIHKIMIQNVLSLHSLACWKDFYHIGNFESFKFKDLYANMRHYNYIKM